VSTLSATHVTARGLIGTSKAAVQKTSDTCAGDCGLRHWNRRKHPFIWTKTPDEILDRIDRKRKHVSATRH